jgi:hypothetical protein
VEKSQREVRHLKIQTTFMGKRGNVATCSKCLKSTNELGTKQKEREKEGNIEILSMIYFDLENLRYGISEDELDNYREFVTKLCDKGKECS